MKITAIVWNSHAEILCRAAETLPWLTLRLYPAKSLEDSPERQAQAMADLRGSDAAFLYRATEPFWDDLEADLKDAGKSVPTVCLSYDPSLWGLSTARPELVQDAHRYVTFGGIQNVAAMLKALTREFGGPEFTELDVPPPAPVPWEGLWHPCMPTSGGARRHFASLPEYLAWYTDHCAGRPMADGPWVGLVLGRHYWVGETLEVEQLLISDLEEQGLRVVPIFTNTIKDDGLGNKGALGWLREVFLAPDAPRPSAVIKLVSFFLGHARSAAGNQEDAAASGVAALKELGVPVFQPVFSSSKSVEEWQNDPQGLGSEVAWSVAMPEFEGVIEPVYLGGGSKYESAATGAALERRVPVAERSLRLARRVAAYIRLAQKPVGERKVAFILHNDPCASVEATVGGAAKLDSLESVARILAAMKGHGYSVDPPATGAALIETIMGRKAISEFRWTTVDEIVQKGGALAQLPEETYLRWWAGYPQAVRQRIAAAWGDPPGREVNGVPPAMIHDGKIVITGVAYGNAAVCVQPKRGCAGSRCDGQVCKILHDPDIPPPHQYIATYRWLQDEADGFGADVLIHVGTHGNLEFLPGKGVGLSGSCLPDLCLHEVPHLYIYNADNPPEGTIAKRRSYAALVDHMTTALTHTELYEDLEELGRLLGEWEQARDADKTRAHMLEHLVRDVAEKANLLSGIKGGADMDFPRLATALHESLDLVRGTQHDDGMHIFGGAPEGERLNAFLWSILRYDADDPRSLRRSLCRMTGLDLDRLLEEPGAVDARLRASHSELLADIEAMGREACGLAFACADADAFAQGVRELVGVRLAKDAMTEELVRDLADSWRRLLDVKRRVDDSKEIDALLTGMAGGYIEPGPSGIITRGREDILPTGRNFYSLDPRRLPTRAAHMVGMRLADAIIAKHMQEEGRTPENVAMFWMCNDMMWADGEGMAQIFHLIGVRPVWKKGGHVKGFEVIPLAELGRPRVDVTIRVSGLLRDSFPEQMELVDEAIHAVACLDEADEDNFVRKHARATLEKSGETGGEAWRKSTLRLFSSKPGTYQAGVNLAVYASAWQTEADLADIFVYWNSYAYGRGVYGEQRPRQLEAALSTVDVSYNKVVSDEHDLFNCCGYYGTHGGLTAAARQLKGGEVKGYYGDTREPGRVQVRDLADEIRRVVRTRLLNPAWIEGMKRHGYKGAGDMAKRVGRVYGWEATTREVDDWIFDDIARTFVMDGENREFFRKHNPWALEEIGRRLLEAQSRGLWQADPEVLDALKESYLEMEGWLEEDMGDVTGDFQGGGVDIMRPEDVEQWQEMMRAMKEKPA